MKKFLMVLGIIFLVVIVGFVALMVWANRSGSAVQEKFFQAVLSGQSPQVMAMMHPKLLEEVDEPVLAAWMKAFKDNLGPLKGGLSATNFSTSVNYDNGVKKTVSEGAVQFEKGLAQSQLVLVDDQLAGFNVESNAMPKNWFKGPLTTDAYRQRGREFLTAFTTAQADKAFAMMHPKLQEALPLEALKSQMAGISGKGGGLKAVEFDSEKMDISSSGQKLTVKYALKLEKGDVPASVTFEFAGLKGHMVSFSIGRE